MPDLRLYNMAECPFCWKIRLALNELQLDADIIDYKSPSWDSEWQKFSPRKTVPVLLSGDIAIYESSVILEFLQEITGRLLPETTTGRVQARLLNIYIDSAIGAAMREVIMEKRGKTEDQWDRQRIETGIEAFHRALPFLADQLGEGDYFTERYSLPECALTARFGLAEAYGIEIPEEHANLKAWFVRMKERTSYKQTLPESWR